MSNMTVFENSDFWLKISVFHFFLKIEKLEKNQSFQNLSYFTSFDSVFDADSEYGLGFAEELNFYGDSDKIRARFGQNCPNF